MTFFVSDEFYDQENFRNETPSCAQWCTSSRVTPPEID